MEKKVAIYCRVSTQMQSTDRQESELKEYANKQGYTVTEDCVYVDVISGFSKTEERPQYLRLLADSKKKGINLILFSELTRLGRNSIELQQEIEEFQKKDIALYFQKQNLYVDNNEETLGTKILLSVLAVTCTYEIKLFAERSLSGKINSLKNGGSIGRSDVNYGYFSNNKKKLEINIEEAEIVKEIFEKYAHGKSVIEIADDLNAQNIPTYEQIHLKKTQENRKNKNLPSKKYKNNIENMKWRTSTISRMLSNEIYIGHRHIILHTPNPIKKDKKDREIAYVYDEQCEHLRIITNELFQQVQDRLAKAKYNKNNAIKHNNLLKAKMKCGECGGNYSVGKSNESCKNYKCGGRSYICYGRIKRHDKEKTCNDGVELRQWRLDGLTIQLCSYIFAEIQNDKKTVKKIEILKKQNKELEKQINNQTDHKEKITKEYENSILRLTSITGENNSIINLMNQITDEHNKEIRETEKKISKYQKELTNNKITIAQLKKLKNSTNLYHDIDTIRNNKELLQNMVNDYIDSITIYKAHKLWSLIVVRLTNDMEMWGTIKNARYKNDENFYEPLLCKYGIEFITWVINNSEQCFQYDKNTKLFTYTGESEIYNEYKIAKGTYTFDELNQILTEKKLIGSYSLYDFEGNSTPTHPIKEYPNQTPKINWTKHNKKVLENLNNKNKK